MKGFFPPLLLFCLGINEMKLKLKNILVIQYLSGMEKQRQKTMTDEQDGEAESRFTPQHSLIFYN